ncbi:MAG TPA: hypothetical protein PLD14_00480 [Candidatus Pacearchaeota archaeon]|nr:hypothetical protein [Candidatus Pacearchaeota archaeon]HPR79691.1 hypothetical protein [Candidatus Pacearchaeota archaeon]
MAIEITPEKKEADFKENLILVFSIIVFLMSLSVYFYFNNIILSQKKAELVKSNNEYTTLAGSDIRAKEEQLKLAGKYIGDFKTLFENNPKISGFFASFQGWTHPKVVFSGFIFDVTSRKITMSGSTDGFQNVIQQIAIMKVEPTIESYQISNVNLAENGLVKFNLELVIKPEVLK